MIRSNRKKNRSLPFFRRWMNKQGKKTHSRNTIEGRPGVNWRGSSLDPRGFEARHRSPTSSAIKWHEIVYRSQRMRPMIKVIGDATPKGPLSIGHRYKNKNGNKMGSTTSVGGEGGREETPPLVGKFSKQNYSSSPPRSGEQLRRFRSFRDLLFSGEFQVVFFRRENYFDGFDILQVEIPRF